MVFFISFYFFLLDIKMSIVKFNLDLIIHYTCYYQYLCTFVSFCCVLFTGCCSKIYECCDFDFFSYDIKIAFWWFDLKMIIFTRIVNNFNFLWICWRSGGKNRENWVMGWKEKSMGEINNFRFPIPTPLVTEFLGFYYGKTVHRQGLTLKNLTNVLRGHIRG